MLRIVPSVTTLEQHHRAMAQGAHEYRLPACPHCGLGKPWRHGSYQRKVDRHAGPNGARQVARVCRFLCRGCRRTHSRLPLCIAPRRWYDWAVQQWALVMLLAGASLRAAAKCVAVDRQTARRWRGWLATTNIIESPNSQVRRVSGRVTHYRDAQMAMRWTAAGFLEAEKAFQIGRAHV